MKNPKRGKPWVEEKKIHYVKIGTRWESYEWLQEKHKRHNPKNIHHLYIYIWGVINKAGPYHESKPPHPQRD